MSPGRRSIIDRDRLFPASPVASSTVSSVRASIAEGEEKEGLNSGTVSD